VEWIHLAPCFSVYFNSRNHKNATELTEELLPTHNKSNRKSDTIICLSFMCIACKISTANLRLIDNLIVSPDISKVYGEPCWLTVLQNWEASGLMQRLIVCVLSVTGWLVSNVGSRILIRTLKFRRANKTLPPLRIIVSRNSWHTFAEPLGFRGTHFEEHWSSLRQGQVTGCFEHCNVHWSLIKCGGFLDWLRIC